MDKSITCFMLLILFSQTAQALSSNQLIMIQTVREHILAKRDAMVETLCYQQSVATFDTDKKEKEEILCTSGLVEAPVSRRKCLSNIYKKCRSLNRNKELCELFEKARRYDKAAFVYDEVIENFQNSKLQIKIPNLGSVMIIDKHEIKTRVPAGEPKPAPRAQTFSDCPSNGTRGLSCVVD